MERPEWGKRPQLLTKSIEAAAEKFNKPLLQITCGDLGSTAKDVEEALKLNFNLASRWNSVLLLDEADVFLATRRRDDFARNALVAANNLGQKVFLRTLEYYAGILFLTTNRVGDFDEAFKSRIHMSLYYPPLDMDSTWKIFRLNFSLIHHRYDSLERLLEIEEVNINDYVTRYWKNNPKARWNGRQIRNACQTALALAEYEALKDYELEDIEQTKKVKVRLSYGFFERVGNAYLEFNKYLTKIQGTDDGTYAYRRGLRAKDDWNEVSDESPPSLLNLRKRPNVEKSSSLAMMADAGQMDAGFSQPPASNQAAAQPGPDFGQPQVNINLPPEQLVGSQHIQYPPPSPATSHVTVIPTQSEMPPGQYSQSILAPSGPPVPIQNHAMNGQTLNPTPQPPYAQTIPHQAMLASQPLNNLTVPPQTILGHTNQYHSGSQTMQQQNHQSQGFPPANSNAPSVSLSQKASIVGRSSAAKPTIPRVSTDEVSHAESNTSSKKKKKAGLFSRFR
ncbi:hypothetical protein TD95_000247 [Thielaviopsis punctulata]|uniref:Uncharacterized protein n=1 Tax=Thielaviopsis punctulata TaxID=72032 RepID=A0A0F4ZG18_9PEZI|nr:hypothetical protein TD95_000247 [Thielaviopsis punctulata]